MAKTLLYRLFGIGKIPDTLRSALKNEGIVLCDETVRGSVNCRDFQGSGKQYNWRRQVFIGSLALTRIRLLVLWSSNPIINVPLADERNKAMRFTLEDGARLCVAFEAGLFHADCSGRIEYRFQTP